MIASAVSGAAIDARSLSKSYGSTPALTAVDLEVARGEILALVGANGAGKTTFMRLILDLIRPTSGRLAVLGLDSVRDSVAVRTRTTYLPGELVIPRQLTGEQAFRRYTFARGDVPGPRVRAVAGRLDLDLSRRVGDLSKGNKQKLGLLIALAPPADLLVLDEPTSGLDPVMQRIFADLLRERAAEGAAVLLSSHVMSEVEQIAARVALLRGGAVALVDDIEAIRGRSRRRGQIRPHDRAELTTIAAAIAKLTGVSDVMVDGDSVHFASSGDMDQLVKRVAEFSIVSFDVAHGELEDAFFSVNISLGVTGSDLRIRRTSLLLWWLAVAALVAGIAAIYPIVRDNPSLDSIYGDLSPTLQALLGGSSLTSPAGYLNTQLFAFFLPAVMLVFAIGRGAGSIAGEEEERTLDLLLAQPVARGRLYVEKALALVIGVAVLTAACVVAVVALRQPAGLTLPYSNLVAVCVQLGLMCAALGLGAQAIASASGKRVVGIAASAGYTFVSYVVYGLSATVHALWYVRPLTLWRWYLGTDPVTTGFSGEEVAVLAAVCVAMVVLGCVGFRRRDLHA